MQFSKLLKHPFTTWLPPISSRATEGLGTFSGVYLPNILQMLGIVLFMRLGWITGHLGIVNVTFIILMASSILFVTGLSMNSIVTNMKIGSGGSYYIISRSLGLGFGSSIGILLAIAQIATIAICVSGFVVTIHDLLPNHSLTSLEITTLLILTLISIFPTNIAVKTQGVIFFLLLLAILSVFMGGKEYIPADITPLPTFERISFWGAFALFFPAVTGIESGMAMSGELKNPSRSLAIGTIASVISAYIIYVSLSLFLANEVPVDLLKSYPLIIQHISKYTPLFIVGIWGATLSSAIGGILTAPRTLQALAKDKILPSFFAKGYGKQSHPIVASLCILSLATILTLLTDMNQLLPILSMVCLITYGLINFVSFFEAFVKNPSWRPLFHIHWTVSLGGTIACLISMFMINPGWSFLTLFLVFLLCFWTTKRNLNGNWDDIRYGIFSFLASIATHKLTHLKKSAKSWRPNLLVITDPNLKETNVIQFAHNLNQTKGFLTYATTISSLDANEIQKKKQFYEEYFSEKDIPCFFHVNMNENRILGTQNILQNYGLGPLQPNTIILEPPLDPLEFPSFCELIMTSFHLQKNVVLLKMSDEGEVCRKEKSIDVWWGGKYHNNFELSLALAHLMQSSKDWMDAKINIKTIVKNDALQCHIMKLFQKYTPVLRLKNLSFIPFIDLNEDFYAHLATYSMHTKLTFLGLRAPLTDESLLSYTSYYQNIMEKTREIPTVAYVLAGEKINFHRIFDS